MESQKRNKTYERRKKAIDALNGEYNGWWYYQYFRATLDGNEVQRR